MRKAQSLVVQFTIFFAIGFTLFLTIGTFFKFQSDMFKEDAANYSIGLAGSYFSSAIVSAVDTCKQCDYARYSLKTESTVAGYFLEIGLDNIKGLSIRALPGDKTFTSKIYNLNESFRFSGLAASVKPISLTFNRTKNELRVE